MKLRQTFYALGAPVAATLYDRSPGPLGHVIKRGDRATPPLENILEIHFSCFVCSISLCKRGSRMRRIDLVQAATAGWARLTPEQRDRFFKAGLKAALRLDRLEFRAWLLRRLRHPPLAAPVDPAAFAISDRDMALLLKTLVEPRHHRQPSRITATDDGDSATVAQHHHDGHRSSIKMRPSVPVSLTDR
jgi:hypothetical protein